MSADYKGAASLTDVETSSHDVEIQLHNSMKMHHAADNTRKGLSVLALLCGIAALGTSAHTVAVYNDTHVARAFNLALWPDEFDLRPSVALLVGSALVIVANAVSLVFSNVQKLRRLPVMHTAVMLAAPMVGFVAVMVSMIFFYAVNASSTVDTIQSWSCEWQHAIMLTDPDFGTLCHESKTSLYLSVVLVPLELVIATVAGYQTVLGKKANRLALPYKTGSPVVP